MSRKVRGGSTGEETLRRDLEEVRRIGEVPES